MIKSRLFYHMPVLRLFCQTMESCYIFAEYVKLDIYDTAYCNITKVCILIGVWDYCDRKCVFCGIADCQRDPRFTVTDPLSTVK